MNKAILEIALIFCGATFLLGSFILISKPKIADLSKMSCHLVIKGHDGRVYPIRFTPSSKESFEHIVGPGTDVLSIYCF